MKMKVTFEKEYIAKCPKCKHNLVLKDIYYNCTRCEKQFELQLVR